MAKKKKNKKNKNKKKSFVIINPKTIFIMIIVLITIMVYMAPAILFFLGILPTIVAYYTDSASGKNKTLTIGALNFAACFHYMIKIWTHPIPEEAGVEYLTNPKTLILIYLAALVGYLINYGVTILVSTTLKQRSEVRLNKIEQAKESLISRWGQKIDGKKPLDPFGFPIETRETVD